LIVTYLYGIFTAKKWYFTTKSYLFRKKTIPTVHGERENVIGVELSEKDSISKFPVEANSRLFRGEEIFFFEVLDCGGDEI